MPSFPTGKTYNGDEWRVDSFGVVELLGERWGVDGPEEFNAHLTMQDLKEMLNALRKARTDR